MTTAYITKSNFSKIAEKDIDNIKGEIRDVCRRVYESRDISKYLNHKEIKFIECKRLLLESTEECIERHIERADKEMANKNAKTKKSPYIFVSTTPPKYHYERACTFLTKDYLNFLIPPEIEVRGEKEIHNFREFAQTNKQLLIDGKEDVFISRLEMQFRLKNGLSRVTFTNTGVRSLAYKDSCDVSHDIDNVLNEIDMIGVTKTGADILKNFRYKDHWKRDPIQNNDEVKNLLDLKSSLIDLIIKFHLQNNSMNGFSLDEGLLELVGFNRCGSCGKKHDLQYL